MDIRYVAGLFDGEGWLNNKSSGGIGKPTVRRCGIGMTHEGIIRSLCSEFGGHVTVQRRGHIPRKDGTGTHKDSWAWNLKCNKADNFIRLILPHLIVRRDDAIKFLDYTPKPMGRPTFVTINGETRKMTDWCRLHGLKLTTVQRRIERGWSRERALTEPLVGPPRWHSS